MKSIEVVQDRLSAQKLCHYRNITSSLQVVIVYQGDAAILERIIFPGEAWLFEAMPDAELQIQMKESHGIFTKRTGCDRYQVKA